MAFVKTAFFLITLLTFIEIYQCGRYGGSRSGSRSSSRGSYSSGYHPSFSSSSYARPRPSPSWSHPSATSRPRPITHNRPTSRPSNSYQPHYSTSRPYALPRSTSRSYQSATTRRPMYVGSTPRHQYTSARTSWNNLPPKPGSGPIGPSHNTYHTQSGPQKVKIVNKYNYHYPGYYSMPMQHYSYPGYFYTPSYYRYSSGDTGSTALGFFLGYSFSKLTTPTYSHYSYYDGYRPRYDHYEVHHYYHNRDSVPPRQEIPANTIVGCVGDSVSVCPANTTSLCTSSGTLMCVANVVATVPCADNRDLKCVTSTISCVNNTAPECKNSQGTATINIPCVSNAEVHGDVKYVNNTLVAANATTIGIPVNTNSTLNNTSTDNATNNTSSVNGTVNMPQGPPVTSSLRKRSLNLIENNEHARNKREAPQNFCVTVLAVPAKRQATEGEEFLKDAMFLTGTFVEKAWNL